MYANPAGIRELPRDLGVFAACLFAALAAGHLIFLAGTDKWQSSYPFISWPTLGHPFLSAILLSRLLCASTTGAAKHRSLLSCLCRS
jgi:hypothetical protein